MGSSSVAADTFNSPERITTRVSRLLSEKIVLPVLIWWLPNIRSASAAFYFNSNKIWAICDRGADDATVTRVTKAVNGGTTGLPERIQNFRKFMQALS